MAIFNLTNKEGLSGIKGFVVTQTPYNHCIGDPEPSDYGLQLYHDGAGVYPQDGDTIYKNYVGTIKWTSADETLARRIEGNLQPLRVDADGIMDTLC